MSDLAAWIDAREPRPPVELAAWVEGEASSCPSAGDLTVLGVRTLARACARPGRVRESAFHLLAADALITYACEVALEAPDPSDTLRAILIETAHHS